MAFIPTSNFGRLGVPTHTGGAVPAGGGDSFNNTGNELIVVFNGSPAVTPMSVTIPTVIIPGGFKAPDFTRVIPPGESFIFGPFPVEWFGPTPVINYSTVSGIIVHVIRPTEMTKL